MLSESLSKHRIHYIDSVNYLKKQSVVRRKPGRPPKQHPPGTINGIIAECAVCHDRATGLHYAVMTCEGCKGFFKRSIQAEKTYRCRNNGDCIINKESRNACQACRMKSCFEMGMKENLVRYDRTPGNRKKKCLPSMVLEPFSLSDSTDNIMNHEMTEVKRENTYIEPMSEMTPHKNTFGNYNSGFCEDISNFTFGNIPLSYNPIKQEILSNKIPTSEYFEDWELSLMGSDVMLDGITTDVVQHINSVCDPYSNHMDLSQSISINCSGNQDLPPKKCSQSPKCLMHLLTRLMKAKPVEPAFCKYYDRYPTSNQFLDCLADEIHLIIKFAKKTPGFCELSMNRKLGVVQKQALSILFIRVIFRSLTCPHGHVQFAANMCLNFADFDKIEILSKQFRQSMFELISSYKSLNLDIYELCLIQYAIIEDEDWDPDIYYYPMINGCEEPSRNLSQKYLRMYTTNKYPDQPHRWIFIMLSLTQAQEMVKMFTSKCLDLVNAQRMIISNDILKEIFSI